MYNASDRKDIRRAEKVSKLNTRDRLDHVRASMSTIQGRAWFYNLLSSCRLFNVSFNGEPHWTAFFEGERNIGVQIYNDIMLACPDLYVIMIREAQVKELSNARSEPDLYDTTSRELPGSPTSNGGDPGPSSTSDYSADDDGGWGNLIGLGDE